MITRGSASDTSGTSSRGSTGVSGARRGASRSPNLDKQRNGRHRQGGDEQHRWRRFRRQQVLADRHRHDDEGKLAAGTEQQAGAQPVRPAKTESARQRRNQQAA